MMVYGMVTSNHQKRSSKLLGVASTDAPKSVSHRFKALFLVQLHQQLLFRFLPYTLVDTAYTSTMSGQASYAYDASAHAAAQAAAQAAGTSTAADPYAAFYYWDPAQNNYAFDYDSYYTTYGYPDQAAYGAAGPSTSGTSYDPNFAADANAQASAYMPTPEGAAAANGTAANAEKKKGRLQKGETRQTVLRKAAGILWEDETLLEWDPCECHRLKSIAVNLGQGCRLGAPLTFMSAMLPSKLGQYG